MGFAFALLFNLNIKAQNPPPVDEMIRYFNAGLRYEQNGYTKKAIESYKKALSMVNVTINTEERIKKIYCMAAVNLGNVYLSLGNIGNFYKYYSIAARLGDRFAQRVLWSQGVRIYY